jgi:hypothetical protein
MSLTTRLKLANVSTKTRDYKGFNLLCLVMALSPVFLVGLINLTIDPYGILNSPTFPGLNKLKPAQDKNNKLFKTIDIIRLKPTTILGGSSRAILGLDPNHSGLSDKNSYNLGIPGVHIDELNQYVEHAIKNQPNLKQIVVGIDFFMFNSFEETNKIEENLNKTIIPVETLLNTIFSWQTLESSQSTFAKNREFPSFNPYYYKGMRRLNTKIENETNLPMKELFKNNLSNYLGNPAYYKDYHLSEKSLQEFKKLASLCKSKNINLKVFISPEPAAQLEAIRVAGLWPVYEQWKREVSQVTPVWDFSGYNSINTEPIRDDMKHFLDSTHYTKEIGDRILNRLFSYQAKTVPNDFGIFLTPANIETHLATTRTKREAWAKNNSHVVKFVQDIKRDVEQKKKK